MRRRSKKLVSALLLLVVTAAVPGCSTSRAQRPSPPAGADPVVQAEVALTSDAASLRQAWYLTRAEKLLDEQCMNAQGLRYFVDDPGPQPGPQTVTTDSVGTGRPATYGVAAQPATRSAEDLYVAALPAAQSARYLAAFRDPAGGSGTLRLPSGMASVYSTGGCLGEIRIELYGSVQAAIEEQLLPQDVRNSLNTFLQGNHPYLTALQNWQQCMSAAGRKFATPQAAIGSILELAAQDAKNLDSQQAAVADADVTCDARSGLRLRIAQARDEFLRKEPPNLIAELAELPAVRAKAVSTATIKLANLAAPPRP
jgi:hypothetical protein